MLIRAVIFDLDGTLLDSVADLSVSVNHARSQFGLSPLPQSEVAGYVGDGVWLLIERSFKGTGVDIEAARKIMAAHYETQMFRQTRPYPGVAETLPLLTQKKAVATNKPGRFVSPLLEKGGILKYFDLIVGGDTLKVMKPDPAVVGHVSAVLGVPAGEIAVVGDHRTDLELARRCGCISVFCEYGIGRDDGIPADFRIREFRELIPILASGRATG